MFDECSAAAVVLEIFQDHPCLTSGNVRAHLHMKHDGLPLSGSPLGRITLGVAPVAMHRVKLRSGEQFFGRNLACIRRNGLGLHGICLRRRRIRFLRSHVRFRLVGEKDGFQSANHNDGEPNGICFLNQRFELLEFFHFVSKLKMLMLIFYLAGPASKVKFTVALASLTSTSAVCVPALRCAATMVYLPGGTFLMTNFPPAPLTQKYG